jgi:hypothetical protein
MIEIYQQALDKAKKRLEEAVEALGHAGIATKGDYLNAIVLEKKKIANLERLLQQEIQEQENAEKTAPKQYTQQSPISKLLFLSALATGASPLRLDQEQKAIRTALDHSVQPFMLLAYPASKISDLEDALLKHQPHFIHFAGHADAQGLSFLHPTTNQTQQAAYIPLAKMLRNFQENLQGVFFNACFSAAQAEAFKQFLPDVAFIAMDAAVPDPTAIRFATTFYKAIAAGRSIRNAFDTAVDSIDLHGLKGSYLPVCLD